MLLGSTGSWVGSSMTICSNIYLSFAACHAQQAHHLSACQTAFHVVAQEVAWQEFLVSAAQDSRIPLL